MAAIETILSRLHGVKERGSSWTARCPAHDDRSPSLSISVGDDGRVLMHCHAGCTFEAIMAALGFPVTAAFGDSTLEHRVLHLERKQREIEKRLGKLEQLRRSKVHLQYHRNLSQQLRHIWYEEGIFDEAIDRFVLGYAAQCPSWSESASATIPVFGYTNELENVRHRLLSPGKAGKYRPEMSGLGQQLFNAPILNKSHERLLILEGEKKTIVYDQCGYAAVGIMGQSVWKTEWLDWLDADQVLICLDPDAQTSASRLGGILVKHGLKDVRTASFPVKPDDLIQLGAKKKDIDAILAQARPVRL